MGEGTTRSPFAKQMFVRRILCNLIVSVVVYTWGLVKVTRDESPAPSQCLVTAGVSLNMMAHGLVVGFATVLLPQLRHQQSSIHIDDSSGSWIASIVGFSLLVGAFLVTSIMSNFGRRVANILSLVPLIAGWLSIVLAPNVSAILAGRFLQGLSMGMSATLSPMSIGEYTSPKNRGAFLTTISLAIASGVLLVHTLGSFLSWRHTSLVCAIIAFVDFLIIYHSPETPGWLADKGRHEECRRAFRWLRGPDEEDELRRMIEVNLLAKHSESYKNHNLTTTSKIKVQCQYINVTIKKKEFYKPLLIMLHLFLLNQWSGANLLAAYMTDIVHGVVGDSGGLNAAVLVITMGVQRIVSNTCAIFVIRKVKRRTMLFATVTINIVAFLMTAAYVYAKAHALLPAAASHPAVGILLLHLHMFSIATGTVPLPNIIAGEIFPLEYRSIGGAITVLFLSMNLFASIKTAPFLFAHIGLHGAYCVYAAVVAYCLLVAWLLLPETKDRTLQDIEDEFRGRALSAEDMKSATSLTSARLRAASVDRRCSSPALF